MNTLVNRLRLKGHKVGYNNSAAVGWEPDPDCREAVDRIAALEAEVATLKEHLAILENANASISADNCDLRAEAKTARELMYNVAAERDAALRDAKDFDSLTVLHDQAIAERDRLKTAVAPMVDLARAVDPSMEDAFEMTCLLTAGQLRNARALAANPSTEEGG